MVPVGDRLAVGGRWPRDEMRGDEMGSVYAVELGYDLDDGETVKDVIGNRWSDTGTVTVEEIDHNVRLGGEVTLRVTGTAPAILDWLLDRYAAELPDALQLMGEAVVVSAPSKPYGWRPVSKRGVGIVGDIEDIDEDWVTALLDGNQRVAEADRDGYDYEPLGERDA